MCGLEGFDNGLWVEGLGLPVWRLELRFWSVEFREKGVEFRIQDTVYSELLRRRSMVVDQQTESQEPKDVKFSAVDQSFGFRLIPGIPLAANP